MSAPIDPVAVVADFIETVAPYDRDPDNPVAMIGVRTANGEAVFTVSDHIVRAMCKALASYRDPEDRGTCVGCGGRNLDENLHCPGCGQLHGILGQVIAQHAARIAAESGSPPHGSDSR